MEVKGTEWKRRMQSYLVSSVYARLKSYFFLTLLAECGSSTCKNLSSGS
jgi:hypothetical protein